MDHQTKMENNYDQNALKFHKILIIASYVSTGARPVTKGGENEVQNDKCMEHFWKYQKSFRMILDESREVHEVFSDDQNSIKNVTFWRLDNV